MEPEPTPPKYENFSNDEPVAAATSAGYMEVAPSGSPAGAYMEVMPPGSDTIQPTPQQGGGMPTLLSPGGSSSADSVPYPIPCAGTVPGASKADEIIQKANAADIPAWEVRLSAALKQPCKLNIPFDSMLASMPDGKTKVKALQVLVSGPKGVINQGLAVAKQESSLSGIEILVRAIEQCCKDDGVRGDLAKAIRQIDVINQPSTVVPESKSFTVGPEGILYSCVLSAGYSGIFSKKEVLAFFEEKYYAQERALVTNFIYYGLPEATKRIQTAIGRDVDINFDVVNMLGSCSTQGERLPTARTIVTRTKMTEKAAVAAKSTMASLLNAGKALANKAQDKPPPEKLQKEEEPFNSPNVLVPLVEAIEFVCSRHPSVTQAIAACISTIQFAMIPGSSPVASLELHQSVDSPVVAPSRAGVPPIKDGVLLYTGCFEMGAKGCHTKQHIIDVFEEHFRCREKGYVHQLMAQTVPVANQTLSEIIGAHVEIEVVWPAIFHENLTTKQRLTVAETLCEHNSQFAIMPMVHAIRTVVQKFDANVPMMEAAAGPPDNPIKNRIRRVQITGTPGESAKPSITLQPLAQGSDMSSALIYTCAFERGTRGCFDVTDFKSDLRKLFGIATPKDESGVHAGLEKADATVTKLAADVGKQLNKLKFW